MCEFKSIINAIGPTFSPVAINPERGVATGILTSERDGQLVTLAYDQRTGLASILSKPAYRTPITLPGMLALSRVQNNSKLVRVGLDEDHHQLLLQAVSLCNDPEYAPVVLQQLCTDLSRVINDDRLRIVLGN